MFDDDVVYGMNGGADGEATAVSNQGTSVEYAQSKKIVEARVAEQLEVTS